MFEHDPYGVPTGSVPRVKPVSTPRRFLTFDEAIHKVLDEYALMQRKAAAFDKIASLCKDADIDHMRFIFEIVDRTVPSATLTEANKE